MPDRELLKLQEEIETLKAELAAVKRDSAIAPPGVLRRLLASPRVRIALAVAVVAIPLAAYAAQISVPYNFVNGTVADATEVNANFTTLETESNAQDLRLAALEASVAANSSDIGAVESDVATLQSDVGTNTGNIGTLQTDVSTNAGNVTTNAGDIGTNVANIATNTSDIATNTGDIATLQTDLGDNTTDIASNTADIGTLNTTFTGVSRGGTPDTLTFSGMNVQLIDGTGDTYGAVNGLGNLIVGYNENSYGATRTGSHNLVIGFEHEYTSGAPITSPPTPTPASAGESKTRRATTTPASAGASSTRPAGAAPASAGASPTPPAPTAPASAGETAAAPAGRTIGPSAT